MRLNPMHNALFLAATMLRAETVALKLVPDAATNWSAIDVAVGDTAQLASLGWQQGELAPTLPDYQHETLDLFGITDSLHLYKHPTSDGWAVSINVSDALLQAMPGQFLFHERRNVHNYTLGTLWLGFGCSEQTTRVIGFDPDSDSEALFELVLGVTTQVLWGLYHNQQVNADATTGLPGIAECRSQITQLLRRYRTAPGGVAFYMIGIDDYQEVKRHQGSAVLDSALKNTAQLLQSSLRGGDGCYRYSESVFAVLVRTPTEDGANRLASKLRQELRGSDAISLVTHSIGYIYQPNDGADDPSQLTMCAELALGQARAKGPAQLQVFSGTFDAQNASYVDSGPNLLTADPARDHRNSRLLWQTIDLFANESDAHSLSQAFMALLRSSLGLSTVELLRENQGSLESGIATLDRQPANLSARRTLLAQQALQFKKTIATTKNLGDGYWLATPFETRGKRMGCLFVEQMQKFDAADQLLLKALADQLAGALDRIELIRIDQSESEQESDELKAELRTLRHTAPELEDNELVVRSYPMQQVMEYANKIAATDAPVLILGEVGAGKTLLAKTLHASSNRAIEPFLVIDCAATPPEDLDRVLFGEIQQGSNSATGTADGKIATADGGTLLIDEVSALPLDTQAKLLSFLNDNRFTPINSTEEHAADTRVFCTTNRDLMIDVSKGQFSEALYQRLQFLQLRLPALRERTADIPVLVENFLASCNAQFGKSIHHLTEDAWHRLMNHDWPGNVRQLEDAIMQACVTSTADQLDALDLRFLDIAPRPAVSSVPSNTKAGDSGRNRTGEQSAESSAPVAIDAHNSDSWSLLSSLLAGQIHRLLAASQHDAPIGRWLADAVVLCAAEVNQQVARRAAKLLGVPETTLRRQLRKAHQNADNPFQMTSQEWLVEMGSLRTLLTRIMSDSNADSEQAGLADRCQALVLGEITQQVGDNRKLGAALMGVTPPTYSRWLERYEIKATATSPVESEDPAINSERRIAGGDASERT